MQLQTPKLVKFKKHHKQKLTLSGITYRHGASTAGVFKLRAVEAGRVSAKHLESMKRTARRILKKSGKIWVPVFPQQPITAKPLEVRMGKGKGAVDYWAAAVRAGTILLEIGGVPLAQAFKALSGARRKLPVRTVLTGTDKLKLKLES